MRFGARLDCFAVIAQRPRASSNYQDAYGSAPGVRLPGPFNAVRRCAATFRGRIAGAGPDPHERGQLPRNASWNERRRRSMNSPASTCFAIQPVPGFRPRRPCSRNRFLCRGMKYHPSQYTMPNRGLSRINCSCFSIFVGSKRSSESKNVRYSPELERIPSSGWRHRGDDAAGSRTRHDRHTWPPPQAYCRSSHLATTISKCLHVSAVRCRYSGNEVRAIVGRNDNADQRHVPSCATIWRAAGLEDSPLS